MKDVIIITGPTASGKTQISIDIALLIQNELQKEASVINFDSLLFYKEISIGTAKPTVEERQNITHYMIDVASISSPMNAADFIKMGDEIIASELAKNKICILVGGSAFYLRALLKGMYESTTPNEEIKAQVDSMLKEKGISSIIDYLKTHDPEILKHVHENDHYRLTRAVEHHLMTGSPISLEKKKMDDLDPYDFSTNIKNWNIHHIYLDLPKDEHYQIILNRTKKMMENGLLDEINSLKSRGFSMQEKPLVSIGYKESIDYLNNQFKSLDECIERIAISTRQLAKSQRTFFNKIKPKNEYHPLLNREQIFTDVKKFLKVTI